MSKLVAVLFSTLILVQSSNISFEDFSKLNVLLEHAEYHKVTYGDSFMDFLTEHYGESVVQHGFDHKEHKNLPFKHHQDCTHISHDFTTTPQIYLDKNHHHFIQIPSNFFYKEFSSLFEKRSVFQPPKLA